MPRPNSQDTAGRGALAGRLRAAGRDPAEAGPVTPKDPDDAPIATDRPVPDSVIAEISDTPGHRP
jgi:hypothetical protein